MAPHNKKLEDPRREVLQARDIQPALVRHLEVGRLVSQVRQS